MSASRKSKRIDPGRERRRERAAPEEKSPVSHRLHELRRQVWGAMGIASCAEYASDSKLAPRRGKPDVVSAMELLYEHLSSISGTLEEIIDELGGPPDSKDEE